MAVEKIEALVMESTRRNYCSFNSRGLDGTIDSQVMLQTLVHHQAALQLLGNNHCNIPNLPVIWKTANSWWPRKIWVSAEVLCNRLPAPSINFKVVLREEAFKSSIWLTISLKTMVKSLSPPEVNLVQTCRYRARIIRLNRVISGLILRKIKIAIWRRIHLALGSDETIRIQAQILWIKTETWGWPLFT